MQTPDVLDDTNAEEGEEEGFAELQAGAAARHRDRAALLLLAVLSTAVLLRLRGGPGMWPWGPVYALSLLVLVSCLAWQHLAPRSWQRWRAAGAFAARVAALPLALSLHPSGADSPLQLLNRAYPGTVAAAGGPGGLLLFLVSAANASGTIVLVMSAISLQLPPLPAAALQAASSAALACTNSAHCAAPYMRGPMTAAHITAAYRWLEPLIAPLEPLLWLAGVDGTHPQRRCHCVLAALQFWFGLVLPLLLVVASEGRGFLPYRRARLRTFLLRQRSDDRAAHRHWTRAAAAARRGVALAASTPATDLSTSSSDPSSPETPDELLTVAHQAEAMLGAPAPPGALLPRDWQYEAAYQVYLTLQRLAGWPALLLLSATSLLYAWHVLAFA